MASIALIVESVNNGSTTNLKTLLESPAMGHTCTVVQENSSQSLLAFDLIITTRHSNGLANYDTVINAFNAGVPLICGMDRNSGSGVGSSASFLLGRIGFSSLETVVLEYKDNIKALSGDFLPVIKSGDVIAIHRDYQGYIPIAKLASSVVPYFGYDTNPTENISVAIATAGSSNLMLGTFPANCAFAGFLYASNTPYLDADRVIISEIIRRVLLGARDNLISGYSLDATGGPKAGNKVYLYSHLDGTLVDSKTTGLDGGFEFFVDANEYFLVCDDGVEDNNLKVLGRVTGTAVS